MHTLVWQTSILLIINWIYMVELQDQFSCFCSAVAGRFCSALSMMVHRKVSAESFDNLLLLVSSLQTDRNNPLQKSPGAL